MQRIRRVCIVLAVLLLGTGALMSSVAGATFLETAREVGTSIESGAQKAEKGTLSGARKLGKGIENGARTVEKEALKGSRKVGEGVEAAGRAVKKLFE